MLRKELSLKNRVVLLFMVLCFGVICFGSITTAIAESPCEGDFDTNGDVDGSDLAVFAADLGRTDCSSAPPCEGDFDADTDVDVSDLATFAPEFGRTDCSIVNAEYEVSIIDPSSHELFVRLAIDNIDQDTLMIARPVAFYSVLPVVSNLSIKDDQDNALNYSILQTNYGGNDSERIIITTSNANIIIIEYKVDLSPTQDFTHWILDQNFGLVESQIIYYQPIDLEIGQARARFFLPQGWNVVSRLNPSGGYYQINKKDIVKHDQYQYFNWGPIAFGNFDVYENTIGNTNVMVAFYELGSIQNAVAQNVFSVIQYGQNAIGSLTNIAGLNILYIYVPEPSVSISSRDHILGDFRVLSDDPQDHWRYPTYAYRELSHVIFHTFFAHYNLHLWDTVHVEMEEGIIQFFAVKSLDKIGIWGLSRTHQELIGWYNDYQNFILGTQYDVPLHPESNWSNFPNDNIHSYYGYGIQSIMSYEKYPLVFWLLDHKITQVTEGQKDLNDVWKYFHDYNPGSINSRVSYDELLITVNNISAYDFSNFFDYYISGNEPLPYYIDNNTLMIDDSMLPSIPPLN